MTRRLKQILCGILMLPLVAMPLEANAQTAPEANAVAADPAVAEILNEPPMGAGANAFAYRGTGGYIAGYQRNVSSAFVMRGGYYGTAPKTIGVELDGYLLQFDAPGDADLTVGSYTGATRYPFNTTEPGIDFSGNGRGCNTISGEYFIDDFAYDAQGTTRLAARWVHRCEGGTLPEYGWVTYNTTVRYGWVGSDLLTTDVPLGVTRQVVFRNTGNGPVTLAGATLEGEAFSFAPGQNTCNGATLAAGATCSVGIRFGQAAVPSTTHVAGKVSIASTNNGAASVTLDGLAYPAGEVVPITPYRLVDSRSGIGVVNALGQQDTRTVSAAGLGGIPTTGAIGIMATVVGVTPTADTWLTVWAEGRAKPQTSNVNPRAGKVTTNVAFIPISSTGQFALFNALGTTNVVIDVFAWVSADTQPNGARVRTISPSRVYDTRWGDGPITGSRRISVMASGVPANATAVIMNVAVTGPTKSSWLNISAASEPRPFTAVMNFEAKETLSSTVVSRISQFGEVDVYNATGSSDVIIDIVGYLAPKTSTDLGRVIFINPTRVVDTRTAGGPVTGDQALITLTNRSAAFVNVSATSTTDEAWLTLYSSVARPNVASINWPAGGTRGNLQLIQTGTTRAYVSSGSADLIVDGQVLISGDVI
jgi:hypothetical protein